MKEVVIEKMIQLNQKISSILSKLYLLEEEANFYRLTKNPELFKRHKQLIKEEYNTILKIQLESMELPYDKDDESLMYYRNMIFSVSEQRINRNLATLNFFPIICDNLYSSISHSFVNTQSTAEKMNYLIENHFTKIIEFRLSIADLDGNNSSFQQKVKSFLELKANKINYSFFEISKDSFTDFKMMDEIIFCIDNLVAQNEKIYLHSENDDTFIGIILACYLLKNNVVKLNDVIGYVNYLRSLSRQNEKEFILSKEQINFITQYEKSII